MPVMRKLKIFWMNNWVTILLIGGTILLILGSIVGLMFMESFYRNLTLAQLP